MYSNNNKKKRENVFYAFERAVSAGLIERPYYIIYFVHYSDLKTVRTFSILARQPAPFPRFVDPALRLHRDPALTIQMRSIPSGVPRPFASSMWGRRVYCVIINEQKIIIGIRHAVSSLYVAERVSSRSPLHIIIIVIIYSI